MPYGSSSYGGSAYAGGIPGGTPPPPTSPKLSVREAPPLDLEVSTQILGSRNYRWGADEPDAGNIPDNLTFSDTAPGGFQQASNALNRDPRIDLRQDLVPFANTQILGLRGAYVAFEGRQRSSPSSAGQQSNFAPVIDGWQIHLTDKTDVSLIGIDSLFTNWQGPSSARTATLDAATSPGFTATSPSTGTDPAGVGTSALILGFKGTWDATLQPIAEGWYSAPAGALIAKIYYALTQGANVNTGDTNWLELLYLSSDDNFGFFESSGNLLAPGTVAGLFNPGIPLPFAAVQHWYGGSSTGTDGVDYQAFWDALQVIGDHGLPLQGSGPYGLLASDLIAYALAQWAPKLQFTTGLNGTIQPSGFAIQQALYSANTVSDIITDATQYELLPWGVWERGAGTTGPTFYLGDTYRTWRTTVGQCQLQETGPDASTAYNGVSVQWTASDGTTLTIGPPGASTNFTDASLQDTDPENPVNKAGLPAKWPQQPINIGNGNQAMALQAGQAYLAYQKEANTSGQATLVGIVQDDATGILWPAYMVRSNDRLRITDAADTTTRRIISKSYSGITATLQLDQPPNTIAAYLARLAVQNENLPS